MRATPLRSIPCALAAGLVCLVAAGVAAHDQAVPCAGPLSEKDIVELLSAGVPEGRVRLFVTSCGVDFIPDEGSAERLRAAGASDALIAAVSPPARPAPGEQWRAPIDGLAMVWIPAGRFPMGSPISEPGRDEDELQHTLQIGRGFWLDVTEVTNEAYRRFVLANPDWRKDRLDGRLHDGDYLKDWNGTDYPPGTASHPVVYVSWHAARAYAEWAGKRLPTEAEWEYASRAGTTTPYWWGSTFDEARVGSERGAVAAQDGPRRNPWGLHNVLGHVWEWTATLYREYPYSAGDGREDPGRAGERCLRGGAWASGGRFVRAANRNRDASERCHDLLGFRCAR